MVSREQAFFICVLIGVGLLFADALSSGNVAEAAIETSAIAPESKVGRPEGESVDKADLKYIAGFLEEFVRELRKLTEQQAFPDPTERMNKVSELFLTLRPKNQPDFWMQPYLLLDEDRAIFIFKDGPNHLKYGSNPIAYAIEFGQHLPSFEGTDLLKRLFIAQGEYLERVRKEERFYLALRSIGHSRALNPSTSALASLTWLEFGYTLFIEQQHGRFNDFDKLFKNLIRLRKEALSDFRDRMKLAVRRSREEKVMRKDETEKIQEFLKRMALKWREGWELIERNRTLIQGARDQLGKIEERYPQHFGKSLENYPDLYREGFEVAYSLWAFANRMVPTYRRTITLEELIRLAFVESPRTVVIEGFREGEPNFLDLPYISVEERPIRMILPSQEELKDIPVLGNYRFLAFAIENMLNNADQASPPDKEILFEARLEGDYLRLSVSDQGEGISPQNIWKVSDPDYTTKAGETGHAITGRVVMVEHRGFVDIDSLTEAMATQEELQRRISEGKRRSVGTTITLFWPTKIAPDAGAAQIEISL